MLKMFVVNRAVRCIFRRFSENSCSHVSRKISTFKLQVTKTNNAFDIKRQYSVDSSEQQDLNYEEITNGDKELEHKLKVIALEVEVLRQDGDKVPEASFMKNIHWKELLNLSSRSARQKYLDYLFKISKKQEHRQAKAEEKKLRYEAHLAKREEQKAHKPEMSYEEFALTYDFAHNHILLRIYDSTMNQMYNNRLIQAMKFGQKLVIDLGYDSYMTKRENLNTAKQVMLLFAENRGHDDPFDLHFCNANKGSNLIRELYKYIPTIDEPSFPFNLHECSYLDLFPKHELVYLTPHCREEIQEFDHNSTYIIGGIVDKSNQEPLSLAKAKKEGIKMGKLPLDRYLQWGSGSGKSLTINQVAAILLDQKTSGDWNHSLRHVPRRKLLTEESTLKAIDQAYSRKRNSIEKSRWVPSYNVNFDKLTYNRSIKKETKEKNRLNLRDILNE